VVEEASHGLESSLLVSSSLSLVVHSSLSSVVMCGCWCFELDPAGSSIGGAEGQITP
jgi:hypothetical protein